MSSRLLCSGINLIFMLFFLNNLITAQTNISNPKLYSYVQGKLNSSSQPKSKQPPAESSRLSSGLLYEALAGYSSSVKNKQLNKIPVKLFLPSENNMQLNNDINMSLVPAVLYNKKDKPQADSTGGKSFFKSNLFYFAGAAAAAAVIYILWPKKNTPGNSNVTFGQPPMPH